MHVLSKFMISVAYKFGMYDGYFKQDGLNFTTYTSLKKKVFEKK